MAPRTGAALEASCPVLSPCPLRPQERPPPLPVGWCSVRDAPFGRGEYCQTCVPHVTCFPSSRAHIWSSCSCPRLSPLVSICVLIVPHLFLFSSLLPSILKPWFSPCLMSGIVCLHPMLPVFTPGFSNKSVLHYLLVSSLLALPSESVTTALLGVNGKCWNIGLL